MFAIFLEPLAIALWANSSIQRVQAGQEEHKLILYADDVLLISSNPESSVRELLYNSYNSVFRDMWIHCQLV